MLTIDMHMDLFQEGLSKHTDLLTKRFKEINKSELFYNIGLIEFVIFVKNSSFDIRMYAKACGNNDNKEPEDLFLIVCKDEIIADVKYLHMPIEKLEDFYRFYDKNGSILFTKEQKAIEDWVRECCIKSAAEFSKIPVYFTFNSIKSNNSLWE